MMVACHNELQRSALAFDSHALVSELGHSMLRPYGQLPCYSPYAMTARGENGSYLIHQPVIGALALDFRHARIADAKLCICARYTDRLDCMGIMQLAVQGQPSVSYLYDLVVSQNGYNEGHAKSISAGRRHPHRC